MELLEYHNIVMKNNAWGETFNLRCVCHITSADIPYHSNHSVSTEEKKKYTAFSSAHSWAFSAGFGGHVA